MSKISLERAGDVKDMKQDDKIMSDQHGVPVSQVFRESLCENVSWQAVKHWKNVHRTGGTIMVTCMENREVFSVAEI